LKIKHTENLLIKKLDEWVQIFGMKLSTRKCGITTTEKVFFNSNVWYPMKVDEKQSKIVNNLINPELEKTKKESEKNIFLRSKIAGEVYHPGRYLKLLLKDNMAVDINIEYASAHANWMYILPHFNVSCWKAIQTIHSFGMYLTRFHFLYKRGMSQFSPEFSGFPVLTKETPDKYLPTLTVTKLLRGSYTGLKPDKTKGFALATPQYKTIRRKDRFDNAIKDTVSQNNMINISPDFVKYIADIMVAGTKEERSLKMMLSTMHKPFWKQDHHYILPYNKVIITYVDDVQSSAIYQIELLRQVEWNSVTYADWRHSKQEKEVKLEELQYMLKNTILEVSQHELLSKMKRPAFERDQMVLLPCSKETRTIVPRIETKTVRALDYLFERTYPSSWILPQTRRNNVWIHEGAYMREYFHKEFKERVLIAVKDSFVELHCILRIYFNGDFEDISFHVCASQLIKLIMENDGINHMERMRGLCNWNDYLSYFWNGVMFYSPKRPGDTRPSNTKQEMRERFFEFQQQILQDRGQETIPGVVVDDTKNTEEM
jgi:hypothetical protein